MEVPHSLEKYNSFDATNGALIFYYKLPCVQIVSYSLLKPNTSVLPEGLIKITEGKNPFLRKYTISAKKAKMYFIYLYCTKCP